MREPSTAGLGIMITDHEQPGHSLNATLRRGRFIPAKMNIFAALTHRKRISHSLQQHMPVLPGRYPSAF
jgi:hypothetical protein